MPGFTRITMSPSKMTDLIECERLYNGAGGKWNLGILKSLLPHGWNARNLLLGVGSSQIYNILYTKLPECDAGTAQENHLPLHKFVRLISSEAYVYVITFVIVNIFALMFELMVDEKMR